MRALFIFNNSDLNSEIPGGVQICSQEFLKVVNKTADQVFLMEIEHSRSFVFRILYKLNLDNYIAYNTRYYKKKILNNIVQNSISHVFLNKSELIRFSKLIKELEADHIPMVIVMSHGNESGDLLGDITGKQARYRGFMKLTSILKLGLSLFIESWYRKRYVDLVCTMSEDESSIERWLGANRTFFIPRLINQSQAIERKPLDGIFGYVGTLNHGPNITALHELFKSLLRTGFMPEIRIVGQPVSIGNSLASEYPFIKYLGALNDKALLNEIKSWSFFLNPIFNYSRGASMKLAKAIEWEVPVITTLAGKRGYFWKDGFVIETENSPEAFAAAMIHSQQNPNYIANLKGLLTLKNSCYSEGELGKDLRKALESLDKTHD